MEVTGSCGLPEDQAVPVTADISQAALQMNGISITPDLLNLIIQMQQTGQIDTKQQELITRGSWNQQEDDLLISAVHQLGPKKWTDIAKFVPTRTSKQCRERWFNRLCPDIKHEPFEPWEDQIILSKQKEIGNRWSIIARELPGRSTNAIKNRWYSGLKSQHEPLAQINLGIGSDLIHGQHLQPDMLPPPGEINISMQGEDHDGNPTATDL